MNDPERRVGCLHLMGICANELGEPEQAIGHFTAALASDGVAGETVLAVKLDLGASHEAVGDIASARRVYEEVEAVDPGFGDVVSRLDELAKPDEVEPEDDGSPATEEYESFEEFDEDLDAPDLDESDPAEESSGEAEQATAWESFDDFVAEIDAEDSADAALREAEAAASTGSTDAGDSESSEPAAETETTPKRRKKKISFV
jgi:tetratricopeptide (TPR) repeat protein